MTTKEIKSFEGEVIEYIYTYCKICKCETKHIVVNEDGKILCLKCGFYNTTEKVG